MQDKGKYRQIFRWVATYLVIPLYSPFSVMVCRMAFEKKALAVTTKSKSLYNYNKYLIMKIIILFFVFFSSCVFRNNQVHHDETMHELPYIISLEKEFGNIQQTGLSAIGSTITYISLETNLHVIVIFPFDEKNLEQANKLTDIENFNVFWKFLVSSELEYLQTEALIERLKIQKSKIIPFYNGNNYDFFSDNIFTTLEDIDQIHLNRREIFANQYINAADFGKITVMPDGQIYANVNQAALGNINDDIRELIYNELVNGKSWLRIRDREPCVDCIYQWLCPSPSNYETVFGRYNLCHVNYQNFNQYKT